MEWKRIERADEPRRVSLEVMLRGTCAPSRLLDLVENFTLFSEHKAGLVRIIGQNHQFLGVNNAIASMLEALKLGHRAAHVRQGAGALGGGNRPGAGGTGGAEMPARWRHEPRAGAARSSPCRAEAAAAEKFETLIESYNAGNRSIEELFQELLNLSNSLNDEQERHVRENMSEEELVIFDILTRPAPALSTDKRAEVKKVARELLTRLKSLLVLNWRQKSTARSQLKLTIEDTLDTGLPGAYTPELYSQKCSAVFEHVYESYPERGEGVYSGAL